MSQGCDSNRVISQHRHIGIRCDDMPGAAIKAQPPIGQASGILAGLQAGLLDGATGLLAPARRDNVSDLASGKVHVPGQGSTRLPQFPDYRFAKLLDGRPVDPFARQKGLAQGNGGNVHVVSTEHCANRSRILHRVTDIGTTIDTRQHQIRRRFTKPLGKRIEHTIRRSTGNCVALLSSLVNPQRVVYRDALARTTAIVLRSNDPDFFRQITGNFFQPRQPRGVDTVIVGDEDASNHGGGHIRSPALAIAQPVSASMLARLPTSRALALAALPSSARL